MEGTPVKFADVAFAVVFGIVLGLLLAAFI